jgi:hypothetical protein
MRTTLLRTMLFVLMIFVGARAHAVKYSITVLHPAGYESSIASSYTPAVQYGSAYDANSRPHAMRWNGTAASAVNFTPPGYDESGFGGFDTQYQYGYGTKLSATVFPHALRWSGTPASAVDINPPGFDLSLATAASATNVVGYGFGSATGGKIHPFIWTNNFSQIIDLHPAGFDYSYVFSTSGTHQMGEAWANNGSLVHAILWSGTAASAVDLHPAGYSASYSGKIIGDVQLGRATPIGGQPQAMMWRGTAASAVDIHPAGYFESVATSMLGDDIVGSATGSSTGNRDHALLWHTTSTNVVDLHPFVTSMLGTAYTSSYASGIFPDGTITGEISGPAGSFAALWKPENGLAGDYNNDGIVDTLDYIHWRNGAPILLNEIATLGTNTAQDYTEWRKRYGNKLAGAAQFDAATVPEPVASASLIIVLAIQLMCWRSK